jgi:hypothetical protein
VFYHHHNSYAGLGFSPWVFAQNPYNPYMQDLGLGFRLGFSPKTPTTHIGRAWGEELNGLKSAVLRYGKILLDFNQLK